MRKLMTTTAALAATAGDRSVTLVLVGDLFYSGTLATRVRRFLRLQQETGSRVLIGEPGRNFALTEEVEALASYRVPVSREIEDRAWIETRVLRLRDGVRDDRV